MQPARIGSNLLCNGRREGNYIVLDLSLKRLDARQIEVAAFPNSLRSRLWNHAGFGQGFGGCDFDAEPHAELVFITPDAAHFGPGVACDHALASTIRWKLP